MEESEYFVSEDTTHLDLLIQEYIMDGFIPHWHACVEGPGDIFVEMDGLLVKTKEEAEVLLWDHIQHLCEFTHIPFDQDEWTLIHIFGKNGN